MSLVGDLILTAREQFPDPPIGTVAAPTLSSGNLTASTSGGSLATGTYYVKTTGVNQWGETLVSSEQSVSVTGPNGSIAVAESLPAGASAGRAYYSNVTGGQDRYIALDSTGAGTITSLAAGIAQPLPTLNTAFLPDSDGDTVGAFTLYRWINDGLTEAVKIAGGILDRVGVQSSSNQNEYPVPTTYASWLSFSDAWFDGWLIWSAKRRDIWRRTYLSAISRQFSMEQAGSQFIFRFFPSPNRTGTTGTLGAAMAATDSSITLSSIPSGLVTPGMCQVDNEYIAFTTTSAAASQLLGCTRGWGGTAAAAHSNGASFTELNLVFTGFRLPTKFAVGDSAKDLNLPPGWDKALEDYLIGRFKSFEQDEQSSAGRYQKFVGRMNEIVKNSRQPHGPVPIGNQSPILLYPGGPWGIIVP